MAQQTQDRSSTRAVSTTRRTVPAPIVDALKADMPHIGALLPADVPLDTFRAATWLYLSNHPDIQELSPKGILDGIIQAGMDGLLLGRECYILTFKNRKQNRVDAVYVRHYGGDIKILERTGLIARVFAHPVYAKDTFEADMFAKPTHKRCLTGDPGPLLCVYAYVERLNGAWDIEVMTVAQVDAVRSRAPGREQDTWVQNYDEMARKTVLKRLCKRLKWLPLDLQQRYDVETEDAPPAERTPPTDAQARQLSADLFGDPRPRTYGHAGGETIDVATGEVIDATGAPAEMRALSAALDAANTLLAQYEGDPLPPPVQAVQDLLHAIDQQQASEEMLLPAYQHRADELAAAVQAAKQVAVR